MLSNWIPPGQMLQTNKQRIGGKHRTYEIQTKNRYRYNRDNQFNLTNTFLSSHLFADWRSVYLFPNPSHWPHSPTNRHKLPNSSLTLKLQEISYQGGQQSWSSCVTYSQGPFSEKDPPLRLIRHFLLKFGNQSILNNLRLLIPKIKVTKRYS